MFSTSAGQNIPTGSRTTISLTANNTNYGVSGSGGTVTLGPAGMYWITGTATQNGSTGGNEIFRAYVSYNGTIVASGSAVGSTNTTNNASTVTTLYTASTSSVTPIQLQAFQNSGGVTVLTTNAVENFMHVAFVGGA
jgi:hypothetical protein